MEKLSTIKLLKEISAQFAWLEGREATLENENTTIQQTYKEIARKSRRENKRLKTLMSKQQSAILHKVTVKEAIRKLRIKYSSEAKREVEGKIFYWKEKYERLVQNKITSADIYNHPIFQTEMSTKDHLLTTVVKERDLALSQLDSRWRTQENEQARSRNERPREISGGS